MVDNKEIEEGSPIRVVNDNTDYYGRVGEVIETPDEDSYSADTFLVELESDEDGSERVEFLEKELEFRSN